MNRATKAILVLFAITGMCEADTLNSKHSEGLQLSLEVIEVTDSCVVFPYQLFDETIEGIRSFRFEVRVSLQGSMQHAIKILKDIAVSSPLFINVTDENGDTTTRASFKLVNYGGVKRDDFFELHPGQTVTFVKCGDIVRRRIYEDSEGEYALGREGIYFENGGSFSQAIPSSGIANLEVTYSISESRAKDFSEEFGLSNLWHGKIVAENYRLDLGSSETTIEN
ncbi:MAG: hypothetical protein H6978_08305 [Gammaproteobacteria bacterium]|nr:hypothetical protein [Gammaproteobacteria bacterium]